MKNLALIILISSIQVFAQSFSVKGKVIDSQSGSSLSFANIRVEGTTLGTASNVNGEIELKLNAGNYKLIASFIGYFSDTISVNVNSDLSGLIFKLKSTEINLPEVVVKPGENPALEIIRKAIEKRKQRELKLFSYELEAFSKGTIRTTEDITSTGSGSINLGIGESDTAKLKVTGILESHSKGYFLKPDNYKEIILARKQSANFPPSVNTLTGGRLIQNFYSNDINFLGRDLPGPISNNALDYYYFYIEKTSAINNQKVFQIHIEPDNLSNPGFVGKVFITDSTYDLLKVDLMLNRAANIGGIFDTVNIVQQFDYYDGIVMPVDYRLFVTANFLGLARFGFELNTILFNYKVNKKIDESFFNKAIVTVLPDADKKDSTYWYTTQTIPNTAEEEEAYKRIDSLESLPKGFWDDFSILNSRLKLSKTFSVSAPLAMYHFNRVEGHSIDFGFFINDEFDRRFNSSLNLSYGFSDKKFKQDFSANYLLGDYRTVRLGINAFNKTKILFAESDNYGELFGTLSTLFYKEDFRDYYYTKGFSVFAEGEIFPVLKTRISFTNRTDKSAINNSDFSFFYKDKSYKPNLPVYEGKTNAIKIGFELDFRNYIEDGFFRRRTSLGRTYTLFSMDVTFSNKDLLKSDFDYLKYEFSSRTFIRSFNSTTATIKIYGTYSNGSVPYQDLYAVPGNISTFSSPLTFRTLGINQILGDRVVTLNAEYNFRDELFRLLNIPVIKKLEILLTVFFNAAYGDISSKSNEILVNPIQTFRHPFYEIGFSLGQGLLPLSIEFGWKLNYRDGNNFRISLSSVLFNL
ncbi:MAG: carboxypeptidase-like regulatory domain-containing protein [Ignavibacterium sp.]|jgi:hypothetical protein|uniref:DUF5686 and carboxypeptidase-like regulatory domain-containing protein n=1 Tax=Ignavibacterium sp. TaxID=2651167 RepID=UPI0032970441